MYDSIVTALEIETSKLVDDVWKGRLYGEAAMAAIGDQRYRLEIFEGIVGPLPRLHFELYDAEAGFSA
jgi:hypothetical protein